MMSRIKNLVLGGIVTIALTALAAWLSSSPEWREFPEDTALLRLSFTHSGDRSASCRDRTPEELAKLPPNMRAKQICDRRRPPIYVELAVDGEPIFAAEKAPSGLAGSGPSRIYERLLLPTGSHTVTVRMRDNPATEGFDFEETRQIELKAEQSFVIDFRTESGFTFH